MPEDLYLDECPPGWVKLVTKLISDLVVLGFQTSDIAQIKSKYGSLRFYANGLTDEMEALVDFAEAQSQTICEQCGDCGHYCKLGGWVSTLCSLCQTLQAQ